MLGLYSLHHSLLFFPLSFPPREEEIPELTHCLVTYNTPMGRALSGLTTNWTYVSFYRARRSCQYVQGVLEVKASEKRQQPGTNKHKAISVRVIRTTSTSTLTANIHGIGRKKANVQVYFYRKTYTTHLSL